MSMIGSGILQLLILIAAVLQAYRSLDSYQATVAQWKAARRHERRVAICSQLAANEANFAESARYLIGQQPPHHQALTAAKARLEARLQELMSLYSCDDFSGVALRPGVRRTHHPELRRPWPNWVASYTLAPVQTASHGQGEG